MQDEDAGMLSGAGLSLGSTVRAGHPCSPCGWVLGSQKPGAAMSSPNGLGNRVWRFIPGDTSEKAKSTSRLNERG